MHQSVSAQDLSSLISYHHPWLTPDSSSLFSLNIKNTTMSLKNSATAAPCPSTHAHLLYYGNTNVYVVHQNHSAVTRRGSTEELTVTCR